MVTVSDDPEWIESAPDACGADWRARRWTGDNQRLGVVICGNQIGWRERLTAVNVGAASVVDGLERRSARRRWAALLVLVALVTAAGGVSIAGDGQVSAFSCTSEFLVATVRTNESSYTPGQTVVINVTLANKGPACSIPTGSPCGPPPPGASADNSAGEDVWESGAGGGNVTCPPEPVTSVSYPAGYSSTQELVWSQDKCFRQLRGSQLLICPRTQVPAGTYRMVGLGYGTFAQATATITISS